MNSESNSWASMWSELRDPMSLDFTSEEIQTVQALSRLRDAQGTIFTRELATDLGIPTSTPDLDGAVLEHLNGWFDQQLVHEDHTSKRIRGMVELVTGTQWRPFTDLLVPLPGRSSADVPAHARPSGRTTATP